MYGLTDKPRFNLIDQAADEQWEELDLLGLTELLKEIGRLMGVKW